MFFARLYFQRKPILLLLTIVWTIFEPIISVLVVFLGRIHDMIDNSGISDDIKQTLKTRIIIFLIIHTGEIHLTTTIFTM